MSYFLGLHLEAKFLQRGDIQKHSKAGGRPSRGHQSITIIADIRGAAGRAYVTCEQGTWVTG